jgi:hypothetical protein
MSTNAILARTTLSLPLDLEHIDAVGGPVYSKICRHHRKPSYSIQQQCQSHHGKSAYSDQHNFTLGAQMNSAPTSIFCRHFTRTRRPELGSRDIKSVKLSGIFSFG